MNQAILINHGILSIIFDLVSDKLALQRNLGSSLPSQAIPEQTGTDLEQAGESQGGEGVLGRGEATGTEGTAGREMAATSNVSEKYTTAAVVMGSQANVLLRKSLILLMFLANNNFFVQQRIFERLDLLMQLRGSIYNIFIFNYSLLLFLITCCKHILKITLYSLI